MKNEIFSKANSRLLMISIGLGVMLNPLNSSMVSVAIPALQQAFNLDYTSVSWIVLAFYVSSAAAQPIMGKAGDLFGRRRIFLSGLVVAFAASAAAPLSANFVWLIALRIVQSIGTSMMVAVGMAIVRVHVHERQASALATLSIFLSGAAAIGPFIGGLLTAHWGWPAIFLANLPLAAAGFALARRTIPRDIKIAAAGEAADTSSLRFWITRFDLPGTLLFAAGLSTLFVGLLSFEPGGSLRSGSGPAAVWTAIGATLFALFVRHELRAEAPFVPLRLFVRYPALTRVNMEFMLANLLFYAVFFGLPSYLQQVRHMNESRAGLLMLSLGLCSLFFSPIAGRWVERAGAAVVLRISALAMTAGSIGLVFLNDGSSLFLIVLILAAFGIANGLNGVAMQSALFASTPKESAGVVSGLFNTFRYLGTIFSSLLTGLAMGGEFTGAGLRTLGLVLTAAALILLASSVPPRPDFERRTDRK
ncbi:MFS transporter [Saccharibacillus sp. O23]|uniref:MFS transporter n=1 Tax=Saccharibacillus sp. O23 TaxID=2009338 RepID=UPI000B4E0B6C|nr:MFS transporter [Saccharibacillus sp. O23]OWR32559.1 MFS transporter [Saccharibacillus sp. O23]